MLLQVELQSGLALEGLAALVAGHLRLAVRRQVPDVRRADRRLKVALLAPAGVIVMI
jgi:hypothetical protein